MLFLQVKVLYARNFLISTTPETIRLAFETAINTPVERVKKLYDYAFIHFYERVHAELAMELMQNANIDGSILEIRWAKPVDRDLYRIQKMKRGNAKFNNNNLSFTQTMLLYKQHVNKREYLNGYEESPGSVCSGMCEMQSQMKTWTMPAVPQKPSVARVQLETMCKRYSYRLLHPVIHFNYYNISIAFVMSGIFSDTCGLYLSIDTKSTWIPLVWKFMLVKWSCHLWDFHF